MKLFHKKYRANRFETQQIFNRLTARDCRAYPWEKNWPPWLLTVSSPWARGELTVSSRWPKWSQPAVTEPWPWPWLSCDLAVTEPWSYWRCRDWAVTSPWLCCDLAATELWPRRDWAVTSPSRDWAVIIGPRSRDHCGHRGLTVSLPWPFIFSWVGFRSTRAYSVKQKRPYHCGITIVVLGTIQRP